MGWWHEEQQLQENEPTIAQDSRKKVKRLQKFSVLSKEQG